MKKDYKYSGSKMNNKTFSRILKIIAFFTIIFTVVFCITWQNIQIYLYERKIENLMAKRNKLEKEVYLLNIRASSLRSRSRIARIATDKLDMITVKPSEIRLIVY